ncbi:MAG: HAD-IIB family hydrolase [Waterburya sp.]
MSLIIFTGIDEVLFATSSAEVKAIAEVVQDLQQRNIPLIPFTSKTRSEVADWLQRFNLISPLIVERGSGIFIPHSEPRFATGSTSTIDHYHLYQLGCSYTEARAALKAVQEEITKILRGFGDMDEEQIQSLIGGSKEAARKAKAREFSEYFLTPSRLEIEQLQEVAAEYGFKILSGDDLSLILGAAAEEAKAIDWLTKNFLANEQDKTVLTVGLGSNQQDLALLETVSIPIIIPPSSGVPVCFKDKNWQIANRTGVDGWAESIRQIYQSDL